MRSRPASSTDAGVRRALQFALVTSLALGLSGAGGLFVDDDCTTECATQSQTDPCKDPGAPCAACFGCPCAQRLPATALAQLPAAPAIAGVEIGELPSMPPAAPPAGRLFQPPRA